MNEDFRGKTMYWVEEQDGVGRPNWVEKYNGFDALLARGFFLQTPDAALDTNDFEYVPAIVEIDGNYPEWKLEEIKKGLTQAGVEIVIVSKEFSAEGFDVSVACALLDAYYSS